MRSRARRTATVRSELTARPSPMILPMRPAARAWRHRRIIGAVTGSGIVIEKLVKVYSRRGSKVDALKGIDLEVRGGEIFGLLGPNGAGKTTTVGVCTTRVRATSGRVTVNGIDVRRDPPAVKRSIGVVTQFRT